MAKSKLPVCFVSGAIGQRRDIYFVDVVKALRCLEYARRANDDRRRLTGRPSTRRLVSTGRRSTLLGGAAKRQVRPTYLQRLRPNRFFVFVREPEVRRCFFTLLNGGEADETNHETKRRLVGDCWLC